MLLQCAAMVAKKLPVGDKITASGASSSGCCM